MYHGVLDLLPATDLTADLAFILWLSAEGFSFLLLIGTKNNYVKR